MSGKQTFKAATKVVLSAATTGKARTCETKAHAQPVKRGESVITQTHWTAIDRACKGKAQGELTARKAGK
jgi:hypothetical protein